ncbi:MAG: glycosyltransferase [Cyanobacteria bacterium P01_H01_bin.15]
MGYNAFIFLDIYAQEGGIQAYTRLLLERYAQLPKTLPAKVFALRDSDQDPNPLQQSAQLEFLNFADSSTVRGRLRLAITLFRQFQKAPPTEVFCGHINLVPLIQALCQLFRLPYTVLTYGKEVWPPLSWLQRRGILGAKRSLFISRYSRDKACAANGLDPNTFQYLPSAVDGNLFQPGEKPVDLVEKYQVQDCPVILTVARLWSGDIYKGVDVTLRSLPTILKQFPRVKYIVVGRGDDRPRLEQLAVELNIQDRVVFAGFVPAEELEAHYRLADIYVMPSQEGFGIVYLEAMACGVPVLSGDADGSADPLQDGRLGWRVPHREPAAVAIAVQEMLRGQDRRCDGQWLRRESLEAFGVPAFEYRLANILGQKT